MGEISKNTYIDKYHSGKVCTLLQQKSLMSMCLRDEINHKCYVLYQLFNVLYYSSIRCKDK